MSSSAYVSLYKVLSLINKASSKSAFVEESQQKFLHQIVATDSYYGFSTGRFDAVMVEADNAETIFTCKEVEFLVWFAKILALRRASHVHTKERQCRYHCKANCTTCESNRGDRMASVQWPEVMEKCNYFFNAFGRVLQCMCLRWQKTTGPSNKHFAAAKYGLVPLDSVTGFVNLIWRNFNHKHLDETGRRKSIP